MTTVKELLDEQIEQQENEARIMFIREAAIRIFATRQSLDVRDVWRSAQRLWDNKPNGC